MTEADLLQRLNRLERDVSGIKASHSGFEKDLTNIKEVVHNLIPLTTQTAVLVKTVSELDKDLTDTRDEFRTKVDNLNNLFKTDVDSRRKEAEIARHDRKADRRWFITTMVACSAVIVAAVGLLLGLQ